MGGKRDPPGLAGPFALLERRDLFGRDHAPGFELRAVGLEQRGFRADRVVHERLGDLRGILRVVAVPVVVYQRAKCPLLIL